MVTNEQQVVNGLVLANAVELVVGVITKIAGDEIANQLEGENIYGSALVETVAVKLQSTLIPRMA